MKTSPLILGGTLLFWGIETDNLLIGFLLAFFLEGSALVTIRYNLNKEDFARISDLTSLMFLGVVALVLIYYEPRGFLRITAEWLPVILSPLMGAQLYSTSDKITIGTRFGNKKEKVYAHKPVDFRFYFITICIFAAAAGNSRSPWFYPVLGVILAWILLLNRGRSFSLRLFVSLFILSLGLGYISQIGVEWVQSYVLDKSRHLLQQNDSEQSVDPYKTYISFGDTGKLKLSGEIIMRIDSSSVPPRLLREASYSIYSGGQWFGSQGGFVLLEPGKNASWNLIDPPHKKGPEITIQYSLPEKKGLLPFPQGGYLVKSDTIFQLEQNRDGVVRVTDGASVIAYDLLYHPDMRWKSNIPDAKNLAVPEEERYALQEVAEMLGAAEASDSMKVAAIEKYFQKNFGYSFDFVSRGEYATPLGNFLLEQKSGFCEYYATATTLLLRLLEIPSRYIVGYVVTEKNRLEGKYVVRKRHGHAWVEAFVDNHWVVVDTTPAGWLARDAERASLFEGIQDVLNFLQYKYQRYKLGSGVETNILYFILLFILTAFLVLRIYRRMKTERVGRDKGEMKLRSFERIPSPFTQVIEQIMKSEVARSENELYLDWISRLDFWKDFDRLEFENLYYLHLQLRFDPEGISVEEARRLQQGADKYLADLVPYS